MEIFAGAIGPLEEYSILMQVGSTLSILFKLEQSCHFYSCTSASGQMLQVSFLTNKERLQLFCYKTMLLISVLKNKAIILLNLAECRLILAYFQAIFRAISQDNF